MNESSMNNISIQISGIKHPEFGEVWGGANIELNLSDKALADCNSSDVQKLKFVLPIIAERTTAFVKAMLDREDARRAERKKEIAAENKAMLEDWELRVAEFEEAKREFEKKHKAWERRKEQAKGDEFFESEPMFYKERPHRPNLHIAF